MASRLAPLLQHVHALPLRQVPSALLRRLHAVPLRQVPALALGRVDAALPAEAPAALHEHGAATVRSALPVETGRTVAGALQGVPVSGAAVTVPFLVTLVVLGVVVDFVSNLLDPFVAALTFVGVTAGGNRVVLELAVVVGLLAVVFLVGVASETPASRRVGDHLERVVEAVPGLGSVYSSFDRMSEVLLDDEVQSFREVKLIEFPHADVYSLAFVTAEVPATVPTDEAVMQVLFVPLAPNPVMGGFMVCVPTDRDRDVNMTVEEAFQALVTSGVAMPDHGA